MKIKLKTQLVGPTPHNIGDIIDLPVVEARRFIDRNLAEMVIEPVEPKPKKKVVKKNATNTD